MLGLDRLGEPRIVSPQFQLQRTAFDREPLLQLLQSSLLICVEREPVMQHVMQLRARLGGGGQKRAPDEHAADCGDKRRDHAQYQPRARAHRAPTSKVDGAKGEFAPNGDIEAAALGDAGKPAPITPIASAATMIAPMPSPA